MQFCGQSSASMLAIFSLLVIALSSGALSPAALNATAAASGAALTTTTTTTVAAATTKPTENVSTTEKAAEKATAQTTTQARKPRRLCAFPFWHGNQWHHQCLEYGSKGAQWCSLTSNFTHDEEWRECARYDLMRYKCTIPFHHGSKTHTQCQPLGVEPLAVQTFWCALVPTVAEVTWQNLGVDWTFCEAPNATDAVYLRTVGARRSLKAAALMPTPAATTAVSTQPPSVTTSLVTTHGIAATAGVTVHSNAAAAGVVIDASKSISAASGDGASAGATAGDGSVASSGPGSGLGITLGIVGVVLAAVAVAAAFIVHRRYFRNQYKRIDPLLSSEPAAEKGSYGGMQAYHD